MVVSAPQNPAESSQFLDQTSIAVLSIQAHHPLGTRKLLHFEIALYGSNSTLEVPPVVAIACSPKGAQPLMRVRLQHSGAGPDPFTSFASEIARRTHLAQPSVGRRMIWSLRQSPLARGLPRPIDIKDQPLVAVPIPMSTWLLGRHRPGEHIFQQQGAQGIHRGLVKAGEKAGEGRTMREPLASKQRHEGGGKGKQTIQEVFQGAFATKSIADKHGNNLPEPGRSRRQRLRRSLDSHGSIGDTAHMSSLREFLFSSFVRRHISGLFRYFL